MADSRRQRGGRAKGPVIQAARWSFTWNNYTDANIQQLRDLERNDKVRYLIAAREVAGTGTRHLQGYVEFKRSWRLDVAKKILGGDSIHVEKSGGSGHQNREYCAKEGDIAVEFGELGGHQGRRTDLEGTCAAISRGATFGELVRDFPTSVVKYTRGIQALLDHAIPHRVGWRTQFVWRYGDSGTGKSRENVAEMLRFYPDSWCAVDYAGGRFLNGYQAGCKGMLLDDFAGGLPVQLLLRLLDYTPLTVDVKGGTQKFTTRIIWITSQASPEHYYESDVSWKALKRRFSECGQIFEHRWDVNWETGLKELVVRERNYDDWND